MRRMMIGLIALALVRTAMPAMAADDTGMQASPWVAAASARVRLIAPAVLPVGQEADGAVQIVLAPGSKTYWRDPGETGVPTSATFDGSAGLGTLGLDYPVPTTFDDGAGGTAIGYIGEVVLPIRLKATGAAPHLAVTLTFGICSKSLCIPAEAKLDLPIGRGLPEADLAQRVSDARAAVPAIAPLGQPGEGIGIVSAKPRRIAKGLEVDIVAQTAPGDSAPKLFVEGGDRFFSLRATGPVDGRLARFTAATDSTIEAGQSLGGLRLTLSSGSSAIETGVNLDEAGKQP